MEFAFQIILVILLVFLNGFFVASEFALVGVRKTRIAELVKKGNATAKLVQKALSNLDTYISATQLGITLTSLGLGWVGEPAVARFIEPPLALYLPPSIAFLTTHTLAIIIAFSFITFLHIILGELAPKTVALQRAEATSLVIIIPLTIFITVFKPFVWILNTAGSLVVRLIGLTPPSGHQLVHSEEEIKMILSQSEEGGLILKREAEMVYNVFKLGDTTVKQVMIPRAEIIAFNITTSLKELVKIISKHPHSRFPVYKNSIDTIIGFIHVKDIYPQILKPDEDEEDATSDKKIAQTDIMRQIITVSESKKVDQVLMIMKKKRVHMAIVNDEDGKTLGLVTMEDVIESVVGEIEDEFENP